MKKDKKKFKLIESNKQKIKILGFLEIKKMTKKEKEIEKKVMKLNKITKILGIFFIIILIFSLINNIIMKYSENYTYFYIKNITNTKNGILYFLLGHIKCFNLVFPITFFIIYVYFSIKSASTKKDVKTRNKSYNIAMILIIIFLYFGALSSLIDNQYYNHIPNFDKILFKETQNKTYTQEDLINLSIYLKNEVYKYATTIPRDNNQNIITNIDYNKQAIKDLHNISDTIPLLKGLYPTKSTPLGDKLKTLYGSTTAGLTANYTTYFDYNKTPVSILNTVTHEYCHTKGITRENETVFCSVLAGIKSDNILSNYSGYLEAFGRITHALSYFDSTKSFDIENEVLHLCLTNNYSELCDLYTKNNNEYIIGTEKLIITSHKLKYYKNYINEITNSLLTLKNENAKFYVNSEEKTYEEILSLINEESEYPLRIYLDNNNKIFNKIKDAIKNDNFYLAVYQQDLDKKEPPKIEHPTNFFLEPFPNNDEKLFNSPSYGAETYTYERSARLFLEYFEENGYN